MTPSRNPVTISTVCSTVTLPLTPGSTRLHSLDRDITKSASLTRDTTIKLFSMCWGTDAWEVADRPLDSGLQRRLLTCMLVQYSSLGLLENVLWGLWPVSDLWLGKGKFCSKVRLCRGVFLIAAFWPLSDLNTKGKTPVQSARDWSVSVLDAIYPWHPHPYNLIHWLAGFMDLEQA